MLSYSEYGQVCRGGPTGREYASTIWVLVCTLRIVSVGTTSCCVQALRTVIMVVTALHMGIGELPWSEI